MSELTDEHRLLMRELADRLGSHAKGKSISRTEATAWAEVLLRIVKPPRPKKTRAFVAALVSHIEQELNPDLYRKEARGKASKVTATKKEYAAESVRKYERDYLPEILEWLERQTRNVEYQGLTRRQMLEAELKEIRGEDERRDKAG